MANLTVGAGKGSWCVVRQKSLLPEAGAGSFPLRQKCCYPLGEGSVNPKAAAPAIPKWGSADTSRSAELQFAARVVAPGSHLGVAGAASKRGERAPFQAAKRRVAMAFVCRSIWRARSNGLSCE